jgi:hypothetical protein
MYRLSRAGWLLSLLMLLLLMSACSTVTDAVMGGTERAVGRAVEERVAQAVYARIAPAGDLPPYGGAQWNIFMVSQAQIIFAYSFSAGGYWVGQNEFEPGDYTVFEWTDQESESPVELEKALLKITDDGQQWWRVSWKDEEESWVYEGLLDPEEERMVRLRAKDPEGNVDEVPVTEDQSVYMAPAEPTSESIQGATVGEERITTPAGTFDTEHVVYSSQTEEGRVHWWITDEVPGGVVKYQATEESEELWTSTLIRTGSDATTELDSF